MTGLQAALRQLLEIESRMTPGPWEWRTDNDLRTMANRGAYRYGKQVAQICDDYDDESMIAEPDMDGIAAARNALREMAEALLACLDEIRVRRGCTPESDTLFVERDAAAITDAALQRLADALQRVQG